MRKEKIDIKHEEEEKNKKKYRCWRLDKNESIQ